MTHGERRNWYKLDNAAKVYPVAQNGSWNPMFRLTAVMCDIVDEQALQQAVNETAPRFPSMFVCLKAGFFWYYLEQIRGPFKIEPDAINVCAPISKGAPLLRVRHHANRISIEVHHSVTDGHGGMTLLKTILAQYVRIKYGINVPCEHDILDIHEAPKRTEAADSFIEFSRMSVLPKRGEPVAYKLNGTRLHTGFMRITTGVMDTEDLLSLSRSKGVTITEFCVATLVNAAYKLQLLEGKKQRPIKVSVPVDLRKYYKTETLRNFSQYINTGIDPQYGEFTFDEILSQVHYYLRLMMTEKNLNARISKNVSDEINIFVRLAPLVLKNAVVFAEYLRNGERLFTMPFSNMGRTELPAEMARFVDRFDFILHTARAIACEASAISYNGRLSISFSSATEESHMERLFFTSLVKQGVHVRIESNVLFD